MELKQITAATPMIKSTLLIVPYGIETRKDAFLHGQVHLLIVPYGIETQYNRDGFCYHGLLIVPYGIETRLRLVACPVLSCCF